MNQSADDAVSLRRRHGRSGFPAGRPAQAEGPADWRIAGVRVTPLTLQGVIQCARDHIALGSPCVIANVNMHALHICRTDAAFRELTERSFVIIDGMPVVWLAQALGYPVGTVHRVTWVDLIWPLLGEAAERGWRVFYLGGRPEVLERGLARFRAEIGRLNIAGHHGFFDGPTEDPGRLPAAEVVAEINRFDPDLLIVGMGMPRQEHWVLEHRPLLSARVIMTAGACIDYVAGAVATPPRWMGRWGLEWAYRLGGDPRRLWRRYLLEPWDVVAAAIANGAGDGRDRERAGIAARRGKIGDDRVAPR